MKSSLVKSIKYPYWLVSISLFVLVALSPILIAKQNEVQLGIGIFPTLLYSLPLISLFLLPQRKWVTIILNSFILIASVAEISMLLIGKNLLESGMIVAILTTTSEEASAVINNNLIVLAYILPLIFLFAVASVCLYKSHLPTLLFRFKLFGLMLLLMGSQYVYKISRIDCCESKWYESTILYRPPYHFWCQLYRGGRNIIQQNKMKRASYKLKDFTYGACRNISNVDSAEVYICCIGESMRYKNVSLNQCYRTTTPNLENINNIISYSNYYSTACLTMYAVPLLITPATPSNFVQSYTCCSILTPFKECGFSTFVLATEGQLLTHKDRDYLRINADSLVVLEDDSDIINGVLELSKKHRKSFFLIELWGSHHPYYNYPNEFEMYSPTNHTDPQKYTDEKYFMNAYDNSMLYTDYILSSVIQKLDSQNVCAAMIYTSDHGESISNERYGHGFEHYPNPRDKYQVEYHVPLLFWYSNEYAQQYPSKISAFTSHKDKPINADYTFYSLLGMVGIDISSWNHDNGLTNHDLFSDSITIKSREILLTDGEYTMQVD